MVLSDQPQHRLGGSTRGASTGIHRGSGERSVFVLRYGIAAPGRQRSIRARRGNGRSAISRQPATACQYGMANTATVQPTTNDPLPTVNTNSRQRIENPRLCNRDQDLPITAAASAHAPSPVPATPRGGMLRTTNRRKETIILVDAQRRVGFRAWGPYGEINPG